MVKHLAISPWVILLAIFFTQSVEAKHSKKLENAVKRKIDEAFVTAPKDQEVCFSPDEPCDIKLAKFIESAEKSIDVAIYDITLDQLVHQLLVKSKKIPVRILVDRRQSKGDHSLVKVLIKGGANVRYGSQRGIMHNKFVIVDGKAIETGSFNYSNNATKNNNENQIYLYNASVVERFKKRFDDIWAIGKTPEAGK